MVQRSSNNSNFQVGLYKPLCCNIKLCLDEAKNNSYDFVATNIAHPRLHKRFCTPQENFYPFTYSDLSLCNNEWNTSIVGEMTNWINVDSDNQFFRDKCERVFEQEVSYANHLHYKAILIKILRPNVVNLARYIYDSLKNYNKVKIWIHIPFKNSRINPSILSSDTPEDLLDFWKVWNKIRNLCKNHCRLFLSLELDEPIVNLNEIHKFMGEPIAAVTLATNIFTENACGNPVLDQTTKSELLKMFKLKPDIMVKVAIKNIHSQNPKIYCQYMEYLLKSSEAAPPSLLVETFSKGFEDVLQFPLHPLCDNIDSHTYAVFEKDPVKYLLYTKAIKKALQDMSCDKKVLECFVIAIVGAGRGPLVTSAIEAGIEANVKVRVYAVEKNANSCITLHEKNGRVWNNEVEIVNTDMRSWKCHEQMDIIVSELLGSFSDNELSPECLDCVQEALKVDGIMIPCSYTSWLAPVMTPKLHNQVSSNLSFDKGTSNVNFEMPFVVFLQNASLLSQPQPLFTFTHPNFKERKKNSLFKEVVFDIDCNSCCFGFAGYFHCDLYDGISFNTVPQQHTKDLISWFPIYFPITSPITLNSGDKLECSFWRMCKYNCVWYEYCVTAPITTFIHNISGSSQSITCY